jgi:hypothetical protein
MLVNTYLSISSPSTPPFLRLPAEVLLEIYLLLDDAPNQALFALTCKSFALVATMEARSESFTSGQTTIIARRGIPKIDWLTLKIFMRQLDMWMPTRLWLCTHCLRYHPLTSDWRDRMLKHLDRDREILSRRIKEAKKEKHTIDEAYMLKWAQTFHRRGWCPSCRLWAGKCVIENPRPINHACGGCIYGRKWFAQALAQLAKQDQGAMDREIATLDSMRILDMDVGAFEAPEALERFSWL